LTSAAILVCPSCGSEEPEGSRFCGSCGTPFAPAVEQPAETESVEESTPARATASDAPAEVAPPPVWLQPPPADAAPPPPVAVALPVPPRRRVRPVVLIASLFLLVAAATAAALFGTGAIGGSSVKSDSAFVPELNQNVLGPLDEADATAADNARTSESALTRAADGGRIVRVADEASARLRALSGLSRKQRDQVQVLLTLVAANRLYGQSFGAYTPEDIQGQLALDQAAAAARAVIASAESSLPAELQLPSQTAFISLRPPSTPPSSTTSATPSPSVSAIAYVDQVDGLLRQSHAVVLALNSFVPRAASGAISRGAAVALARSYTDQRRLELAQARALTVPPAFASAHGLLIRSLQASVADDQALVAWTVARRDGSGNAQAAFDRANRIGAQATALKQQFLRAYAQQRQAATGRSPASLPEIF
jgi:hypothetical protein